MNIKFTGKIIDVLPLQSGTSARGNEWQCQQFVIEEINQQYPSKCVFQVFGADKLMDFDIKNGEVLTVHLGINANKGKSGAWFNKLDCWKVERFGNNEDVSSHTPQQTEPQQTDNQTKDESNLPF